MTGQDAIEPDLQFPVIRIRYHHEFPAVTGVQVNGTADAGMFRTLRIAPCQVQRLVAYDGKFVFAVQAAVDGRVVIHLHA